MNLPRVVLVLPAGGLQSVVSPFYTVSFAVHVFLLTLVIVAPSFGTRRKLSDDAILVAVVGSIPSARPAATATAPPSRVKPPPQASPIPKEGVRAASKTPALPDPKPDKPKKKDEPKPKPVEESAPADSPPAGPAEPGAAIDKPADPGPTAGPPGPAVAGGIVSLDAADLEFAWYRAQVTSALRSRWVRPILEDASEPIAATVVFDIRRDGSVDGVRIEASSGVAVMDRSVMRAVLEAVPLPALPASWKDAVLEARYEFRFRPGEP